MCKNLAWYPGWLSRSLESHPSCECGGNNSKCFMDFKFLCEFLKKPVLFLSLLKTNVVCQWRAVRRVDIELWLTDVKQSTEHPELFSNSLNGFEWCCATDRTVFMLMSSEKQTVFVQICNLCWECDNSQHLCCSFVQKKLNKKVEKQK